MYRKFLRRNPRTVQEEVNYPHGVTLQDSFIHVEPTANNSDADSTYPDSSESYMTPKEKKAETTTTDAVGSSQSQDAVPNSKSLEAQVDALCSLLKTFRSTFKSHLQSLQEDLDRLPTIDAATVTSRVRVQRVARDAQAAGDECEAALEKVRQNLQRLSVQEGSSASGSANKVGKKRAWSYDDDLGPYTRFYE
ncbi:hypothetical protein Q7P37_005060 [Cladosporium fusiforme]